MLSGLKLSHASRQNRSFARKMNRGINCKTPNKSRTVIVLISLNKEAKPTGGKVSDPLRFFRGFCCVTTKCGIPSIFVHGKSNLTRLLEVMFDKDVILINLVHEDFDDLNNWKIPEDMLSGITAIFNQTNVATLIRDKLETNLEFTRNNIAMPRLNPKKGKIFSNTITGTKEAVAVYRPGENMDPRRYNTEFIDTALHYNGNRYYTSIRLMCIGSRICQIYVRISEDTNPSVHSMDTPLDRDLLEFAYQELVPHNYYKFQRIVKGIESIIGPGFYAHDLLIESQSGDVYLSETGLKFDDDTYLRHTRDINLSSHLMSRHLDIETYAAYAATIFVSYCSEKGIV